MHVRLRAVVAELRYFCYMVLFSLADAGRMSLGSFIIITLNPWNIGSHLASVSQHG